MATRMFYEGNPQWEQFTVWHGPTRYVLRVEPSGCVTYYKNGKRMARSAADECGPTRAEQMFTRGAGYTLEQLQTKNAQMQQN